MWRFIMFIILCALFLLFVGVNLEHTSDVSIGFHTFVDIPVFLTAFSAFVIGMLFAIPFVLSFGRKRKKTVKVPPTPSIKDRAGKESSYATGADALGSAAGGTCGFASGFASDEPKKDGINKEKSPYGID